MKSGKKLPPSTLADFEGWTAREGLPEDAGDEIVATGEVTINYGPCADKATSHRLLDVSFLHVDKPYYPRINNVVYWSRHCLKTEWLQNK